MELGSIQTVNIDDVMRTAFLDYAMSVIVQRALPDVRDGLKPVARRIFYSMHENGNRFSSSYVKSARIVGNVIGKYHPHGESSVYDAMVRLAQDFSMRYTLVDGQGNFGSIDGDPPAAYRYTEARMDRIADELLQDIDKETVEFQDNYDGKEREPRVLPAKLPNLLLNGAEGIAVGMATKIPPHNLSELCDAVMLLIEKPDASVEELMEKIPGPDFPTGGMILGQEGIKEAYATGRGRVITRAKAHIEENKGRFSIIVTELPYMVNKRVLQERIAELVGQGRIDGISDLNDESDRNGIRLVVGLKRDAQPKKVMNALFKFTQLQTSFPINMLALVDDGRIPRVLTLRKVLQSHIDWRKEVITKRTEFELRKARARAHILEGLLKAIGNIDRVIALIRGSASAEEARNGLITEFTMSTEQAQAILDLQLRRLAALESQKIQEEYNELLKTITELQTLLNSPQLILDTIKTDLAYLKEKYGDARRSQLMPEMNDLSAEDLIPDEITLVTITNKGYIKRLPHDTYKAQRRGGKGVNGMTTREADAVQHTLVCSTLDSLLFFTNKGRAFSLKAHEVPDSSRTAKGLPINNLIAVNQDEQVTSVLAITNFALAEFLVMATRQGKIKRTRLSDFSQVRANGLIAIQLEDGDELTFVGESKGQGEIIMTTAEGKTIRFKENDVRAMGRNAVGVNAIRLVNPNDYVVGMDIVEPEADLLIISEGGIGKRTPLTDFPTHGRFGQGVIAMRLTPKTGRIIATRIVSENDDMMVMTTSGMITRVGVREIPRLSRNATGVMIMRFKEGKEAETIASIAIISEERLAARTHSEADLDLSPNGNGNGNGHSTAPTATVSSFAELGISDEELDLTAEDSDDTNGNGNGRH